VEDIGIKNSLSKMLYKEIIIIDILNADPE